MAGLCHVAVFCVTWLDCVTWLGCVTWLDCSCGWFCVIVLDSVMSLDCVTSLSQSYVWFVGCADEMCGWGVRLGCVALGVQGLGGVLLVFFVCHFIGLCHIT